jgi:cytochrome c oxidase subunit III
MQTVAMEQRKKIHPHKFTLWIGIGSILMMFAGLTSAYIVKRNQANWVTFDLPLAFWYSTAAIVLSSVTIFLAGRSFKAREMKQYRNLILTTIILGVVFIILQVIGFKELIGQGLGLGKKVSVDFLWIIVLLHGAHVIGGIVALIVRFIKAFSNTTRNYTTVPVDVISTYWHFVDALWLYLLVFLIMIR